MSATTLKRQTVRQDPDFRLIDPTLAWTQLENEDPKKFYVHVHRDEMQISKYLGLGFEVEQYVKGGVKPRAVRNPVEGKDIEIRDCVLMSIDRSVREAQDRAGWATVDATYRKIHNKRTIERDAFGSRQIPRGDDGERLVDVGDYESSGFDERIEKEERAHG